jgi:hypothetical protein
MSQWPTAKPDNAILFAGVPLEMEFEASGTILPGDVVEFDTADCPKIKAGQADSDIILGVADLAPASATTPPRGSSRTVAYASGDQVKVISGPIIVMLRLAASEDITCGDHLQAAASGEVKEFVCGTDNACQLLAQSLETLSVNTLSFQWVLAKWLKG